MSLNPFQAVSNYSSMLNKIGLFTFTFALAGIWVLRSNIKELDSFLSRIDFPISVSGIKVSLGYALPAVILAIGFRIFKLHDRISDLFGIRARFDLFEILLPTAAEIGLVIGLEKRDKLREQRKQVMVDVFYKYASSSPGKAVIDTHLITMALDQWSWYWILIEASVIILLTAVTLWVAGLHAQVVWLLGLLLVFLIILRPIQSLCAGYAHQEVKAIVQDNLRRQAIREVFSAL